MGFFPETIQAALAGGKVQASFLVSFGFASGTRRLWRGYGRLATNDGHEWDGLGELGSIDGIDQAVNGEAPEMTFTLSGVDPELLLLTRDEFQVEAKGRLVRVWLQFFGVADESDPDNQRCLDNPYSIAAGRMIKPGFMFERGGDDAPDSATISVSAESLFSLRSRPRHAMYTDRDQQARFPGDRGFQFVAQLVNKTTTWPDY